MISIICACNDTKLLNDMLIPSLKKQSNKNYELIVLDAVKLGLFSAAETLNYGASISKGEILMFCHQDMEFIGDDAIDKIISFATENPKSVLGIAGCGYDHKVYSSVFHGKNREIAGKEIYQKTKVQTLDEVCIICMKDNFRGFDTSNKTWHLYGAVLCLDNVARDNENYVIPCPVYHKSAAVSLNDSFYKEFVNVAKKYKSERYINTTVVSLRNSFLFLFFGIGLRRIKHFIFKKRK